VGGESTRPGAKPVSLQEELDRVIPIIEKISGKLDVCISVDTSSPEVMVEASNAGAHILNDVRALTREGALRAALETGLPICLMHMQGEPVTMQVDPKYSQVVNDVYGYLRDRVAVCEKIGIARSRLLVDPGFGFGKSVIHNYQLLNQLSKFLELGVPILAGLSRKSMIGAALADRQGLDREVSDRLFGSVSGAVIAALNGARIVRVHDVKETVDAMKIVHGTLSA
jgi:dihydropteroate synthase